MFVPKNLSELNQMIAEGMEESINLEYKSADALKNTDNCKKEIAKDVSAMANSAGGVIIYGVKEFDEKDKKHLPEKITPISRKDFSKEQLEHIIQSNISPRIENLIIHPITLENPDEAVYVVEIPQSSTAHQNTRDHRYYKRYNFETVPMLDYEIKDIMNRSRHPFVELEFQLENSRMMWAISSSGPKYRLIITARNNGAVLAKYVNFFVQLPKEILNDGDLKDMSIISEKAEFYGDNTYRDRIEIKSDDSSPVYEGPSRFDPILPGLTGCYESFWLVSNVLLDDREITWTVHADNAAPVKGKIKLKDIKII